MAATPLQLAQRSRYLASVKARGLTLCQRHGTELGDGETCWECDVEADVAAADLLDGRYRS